MDDGEIVGIRPCWYECSSSGTKRCIDGILVYHTTGTLAGKTVNYGEINKGTHTHFVGERITKGTLMGVATHCAMAHIELYQGRRTGTTQWYKSNCDGRGYPSPILDPRPILRCLAPANANYRHGVSFLEDADPSLFDSDLAAVGIDENENGQGASGDDDGPNGGLIAGIVLLVLCLCCVLAVGLFFALRPVDDDEQGDTMYANEYYGAAADPQSNRTVEMNTAADFVVAGQAQEAEPAGASYVVAGGSAYPSSSRVAYPGNASGAYPSAGSAYPSGGGDNFGTDADLYPSVPGVATYQNSEMFDSGSATYVAGAYTPDQSVASAAYRKGTYAPEPQGIATYSGQSTGPPSYTTASYTAGDEAKTFKCDRCNNMYGSVDDLTTHQALRH